MRERERERFTAWQVMYISPLQIAIDHRGMEMLFLSQEARGFLRMLLLCKICYNLAFRAFALWYVQYLVSELQI